MHSPGRMSRPRPRTSSVDCSWSTHPSAWLPRRLLHTRGSQARRQVTRTCMATSPRICSSIGRRSRVLGPTRAVGPPGRRGARAQTARAARCAPVGSPDGLSLKISTLCTMTLTCRPNCRHCLVATGTGTQWASRNGNTLLLNWPPLHGNTVLVIIGWEYMQYSAGILMSVWCW